MGNADSSTNNHVYDMKCGLGKRTPDELRDRTPVKKTIYGYIYKDNVTSVNNLFRNNPK